MGNVRRIAWNEVQEAGIILSNDVEGSVPGSDDGPKLSPIYVYFSKTPLSDSQRGLIGTRWQCYCKMKQVISFDVVLDTPDAMKLDTMEGFSENLYRDIEEYYPEIERLLHCFCEVSGRPNLETARNIAYAHQRDGSTGLLSRAKKRQLRWELCSMPRLVYTDGYQCIKYEKDAYLRIGKKHATLVPEKGSYPYFGWLSCSCTLWLFTAVFF